MKSLKLLHTDYIENIRSAATKMHGSERHSFMAEMTLKYCEGNARKAETVFGWNRNAVETGLGEKCTGIISIGAKFSCIKKSEFTLPLPQGRGKNFIPENLWNPAYSQ